MSLDIDTIYKLLPAIFRTRDAAIAENLDGLLTTDEQAAYSALRERLTSGDGLTEVEQRDLALLEEKRLRGPLKALLTVIVEQVAGLEENIEQLYDDQFIETCADWVVPYIGDLIGYRPLDQRVLGALGTERAEVANTIRFRKRKGTAAVLEELALNITGWDAAVVEFFLRLATTQYLNHIRPDHFITANLRKVDQLERIGTPFDHLPRTADVRRISTGRGKYNIPNIGIFLWRIGSSKLTDSPAFQVDARRYLFNPLGANIELYHAAERDPDITRLADAFDVPLPISRRVLYRSLHEEPSTLYGPGRSLTIQVGNRVLPLAEIESCDLSDTGSNPQTSSWAHMGQAKIAVDPVLGRIAFPVDQAEPVRVTYYYASTAEVGGGEYDRHQMTDVPPERERHVPQDRAALGQALDDLGGDGVVTFTDNGRYAGVQHIGVAANRQLEVRAASGQRPLLQLSGDMEVWGGDSGEVTLHGLLIAGGRVLVPADAGGQRNQLQKLRLIHCTLVPGGGLRRDGSPGPIGTSLEVMAPNVTVEIDHCIVGGLRITDGSHVIITQSIVDGLGPEKVAYASPDGAGAAGNLTMEACTVIGKVHTTVLTASDSIFHAVLASGDLWSAPVIVDRRQMGYLRHSYMPVSPHLPPRFACYPPAADLAGQHGPVFTSLRYGQPGYCQLHEACPCQIRQGAADQAEIGVFHDLYAPQRVAALRTRLDEYLRFGLEAGLIFAS
jgi:hypothetical protein